MDLSSNMSTLREKATRNSSIELLRIFAACAVVVLHYNGMGKAMAASSGITHQVLMIFESFCVCAVDLFIMISGYFLCMTNKRTWDKPIYLLLLLSIINVIGYLLREFITGGGISIITIAHLIIPPHCYFVLLYLTLYVISPYINIVMHTLNEKGRTVLILVMMLLFSVYPTLMDSYQLVMHHEYMGINPVGAWGQQHGYTIVGFSLCYCLGAWLRMNNIAGRLKMWNRIILIFVSTLCIYMWFNVEKHTVLNDSVNLIDYNSLSYSNPFVLVLTFLLLLLFSEMHFQSRFINTMAKSTLVCYIFHLSIIPHLNVESFAQIGGGKLFFHLGLSVLVLYLVSWILWWLLDILLCLLVKGLRNKMVFNVNEW